MTKSRLIMISLMTLTIVVTSHLAFFYNSGKATAPLLQDLSQIDPDQFAALPSPAEGIAVFQQKVERNPQDAVSLTILGQLFFRQARQTGDISSYQRAETALRQAIRLLPNNTTARLALASTLFAQHDFGEALKLARALFQEDARRTEALAIMADAYLAIGQYQAADQAYTDLSGRAATPPVWARLAYQAELHGRPEEALRLLQQAAGPTLAEAQSKEDLAWYLIRLGDLYFNLGQPDEAGEHYQAALQLVDNYYLALAGLGKVRAAQARYAEAIDFYQQAVAIIPQPEVVAALGDVYLVTGQPDQAERQYETVDFIGRLAEINQDVYNRQLANFYSDRNRQLTQALTLATAELEFRQDIHGYDATAWAFYKLGRHEEAQPLMEQAMKLGTREAKLYYHAGLIAKAQGRLADAERFLTEALAINPHFDLLQTRVAEAALKQLRNR
ncbi:MAG TPA: tetratricopeptide repeat protein [Anaerolineae bacterium]|nr:tetratricopeptide repeat protein [Anaerolineae bacterium]